MIAGEHKIPGGDELEGVGQELVGLRGLEPSLVGVDLGEGPRRALGAAVDLDARAVRELEGPGKQLNAELLADGFEREPLGRSLLGAVGDVSGEHRRPSYAESALDRP